MDPWSETIVRAVDAVAPYVTHVASVNAKEGRVALGTGFALDHFHVVTHAPFAQSADEIQVTVGGHRYEATVVASDPLYFLAVLHIEGRQDLPPPPCEESQNLRAGQLVAAIGDPFGIERTVSLGVISTPDRTIYRQPERFPVDGLIVTDAAIHPGNAGGPLITLEGRVGGLTGVPWGNHLGFGVQVDVVMRLANQMIEYGRATHPWLGFSGEPEVIDPAMVSLFDLPARSGLVVRQVTEGGPGSRAGVQAFDMIIRVDGRPARSLGVLRKALAAHRPGDRARLAVLRAGALVETDIEVEEIPRLAQS